jgi:hypothetical protein
MAIRLKTIEEIIYLTLFIALICLAGGALTHHVKQAVALFAGALFASANLFFLKYFIHNLLLQKEQIGKLMLLLMIKFPLLYLSGYGLMKIKYFSKLYLLVGFTLQFAVMFILAVFGALKKHEQ